MSMDILCDLVNTDLLNKCNIDNREIICGECGKVLHIEDNCFIGVPIYGILCSYCYKIYRIGLQDITNQRIP